MVFPLVLLEAGHFLFRNAGVKRIAIRSEVRRHLGQPIAFLRLEAILLERCGGNVVAKRPKDLEVVLSAAHLITMKANVVMKLESAAPNTNQATRWIIWVFLSRWRSALVMVSPENYCERPSDG